MLYIGAVFHLNLSFSSIPPSEYPSVIKHCYWPLLQLIARYGNQFPVGVELSGWTLERIQSLDPKWVENLRDLQNDGWAEVISGGYNQIVFPLAPYQINRANLIVGQQVFKEMLGQHAKTLLVPEQCWSDALPAVAHMAGFFNLITEYHNVATLHPDWSTEERFRPQLLSPIPNAHPLFLLWSDAILWRHFQRTVQTTGEFPMQTHSTFVNNIIALENKGTDRAVLIYASDAEVFDYRPGRGQQDNKEWERIRGIWHLLINGTGVGFIGFPPVSSIPSHIPSNQPPQMGTAFAPHPTKKQSKYNPIRWATSGLAGHANQQSMDITRRLKISPWGTGDATRLPGDATKDLLRVWGSDYRTNVCPEKQREFVDTMERLERVADAYWITEGV